MTPEDRRPKQTAFRLPQRTLDILDKIVEEGKARTRTDALIWAVDTSNNFISTDNIVIKKEEYEKNFIKVWADIAELQEARKDLEERIEAHVKESSNLKQKMDKTIST